MNQFGGWGQGARWTRCGQERRPCLSLTLQGLRITGSSDDESTPWGLVDWSGWDNGTDGRGGPVPWESSNGGVMTRVDRVSRSLRVEGDLECASTAELWREKERLAGILTRPTADWLVVDETPLLGLVRQVLVTRLRAPQVTIGPDRLSAIWTLELAAADHRRVAVDQSSLTLRNGGTGKLPNAGDADADLEATITGPVSATRLTVDGKVWTYTEAVPSGATRQVSFPRRVVRDPATSLHYSTQASGTWPMVAPGATTAALSCTGSGSITLRWRSSWS